MACRRFLGVFCRLSVIKLCCRASNLDSAIKFKLNGNSIPIYSIIASQIYYTWPFESSSVLLN